MPPRKSVWIVQDTRMAEVKWRMFYAGLASWYEANGCTVTMKEWSWQTFNKDCVGNPPDICVVWNGMQPELASLKFHLNKQKRPMVIHERGFVPQMDTVFFDNWGISGSALKHDCMVENFDVADYELWKSGYVTDWSDKHNTKTLEKCEGSFPIDPKEGYVLILGQIEVDASMKFAYVRTMNQLIEMARHCFQSTNIVFRPHPLSHDNEDIIKSNPDIKVIGNTRLHTAILGSIMTVACNSNALYDTVIHRVPAVAIGRGPWIPGMIPTATDSSRLIETVAKYDISDKAWRQKESYLNHTRLIQVDVNKPMFDHPRNRRVLLCRNGVEYE